MQRLAIAGCAVGLAMAAPGCFRGRDGSNVAADDGSTSGADDGGSGDDGDGGMGAEACGAHVPAIDMRRLSHEEYRNTIADLLGGGLPDPTADFPAEPVIQGFDNNREAIGISDVLVERYRDASEVYATAVLADPERREQVLGCESESSACLDAFVRTFGRRAFRRPLEDDEVAALLELGDAQMDGVPFAGSRAILEAILQSPSFLYRIEMGTPDPDDPQRLQLSDYELATRLSYLLLASTPSDELLDLAEAGALTEPDDLEAAARTLLAGSAAPERLGNFYRQWLDLRALDDTVRDAETYPAWSDGLRASMREEVDRLLQEHLLGGGDLLDVLATDRGWIDADLADLYGVPSPAQGWDTVTFPADSERGGLLTTAAILTITGRTGVTTPIIRGKFIRESLLCDALPPPPPGVPLVPDPIPGESERERLERHRSDPACATCHDLLDPLGFGLAHYDAIGRLRLVDDQGAAISAAGSLDGSEEPDFVGAAALQSLLRDDPAVAACVVGHLHRYAFARSESAADACTLEGLTATFEASGRSFEELVVALVRSDAFRYRLGEGV